MIGTDPSVEWFMLCGTLDGEQTRVVLEALELRALESRAVVVAEVAEWLRIEYAPVVGLSAALLARFAPDTESQNA